MSTDTSSKSTLGGGGGTPAGAEDLDAAALGFGYALGSKLIKPSDETFGFALERGYDFDLVAAALSGIDPEAASAASRAARTAKAIDLCASTDQNLRGAVPLDPEHLCLLDPETYEPVEGPAIYPLTRYQNQNNSLPAVLKNRKDGRSPLFVDANGRLFMSAPRPAELTTKDGRQPIYVDGRVVWSEPLIRPVPVFLKKKRYGSRTHQKTLKLDLLDLQAEPLVFK